MCFQSGESLRLGGQGEVARLWAPGVVPSTSLAPGLRDRDALGPWQACLAGHYWEMGQDEEKLGHSAQSESSCPKVKQICVPWHCSGYFWDVPSHAAMPTSYFGKSQSYRGAAVVQWTAR